MSRLTLHCGAAAADLAAVRAVPTPPATGAHYPIPHGHLYDIVRDHMRSAGLEVVDESHALTHDGSRYFGALELRADRDSPDVDPDYGLLIGLRNTHDRSFAAALAMGSHVFVCDNLAFSGEVLIGRRHTLNIMRDLPRLIPQAFAALSVERVNQDTRIRAYKDAPFDDRDAHDLIVRACVHERVFPAREIPDVVAQWRKPAHDFGPPSAWTLFNAFTECAKGTGPALLERRTRELHGLFDKTLGLTLQTRAGTLAALADADTQVSTSSL